MKFRFFYCLSPLTLGFLHDVSSKNRPKKPVANAFFSLFVEVMLKMQREEVAEFVQHHFVPKSEWPRGMVKRLE